MTPPIRLNAIAGQGAAPFDPSQLSGLALWLKADAGISVANGQTLQTWNDQSGNSRNASQSTAAYRPQYNTNVQNSLPGVLFTAGNGDNMASPAFAVTTWSAFLCGKWTGSAFGYLLFMGEGDPTNFSYLSCSTGRTMQAQRAGSASSDDYTSNWALDNTAKRVRWRCDGTNAGHQLWINGVKTSPTNIGSAAPGSGSATTTAQLMARASTGNAVSGNLFEVVLYTPVLSAANEALVDAYLKTRWNTS